MKSTAIRIGQSALLATTIFLVLTFGPRACTRPDSTRELLHQFGYTEVEITGWKPFVAGEGEWTATGFIARSPSGHVVTGTVTSGPLKGQTIRFD